MKKILTPLALVITSTLAQATTFSDQLFCKDLKFFQTNYQPNVTFNAEFQNLFKKNGGYTNKTEYKSKYELKDRMKRNIIGFEELPILWIYTGHEIQRGLDKTPIQRVYTRTVVSGNIDNVKNVVEEKLNLSFNKHMYQENTKGKYMYYTAYTHQDGSTIVATIQGGSGTNQIHFSCGVYNQNIHYLLENSKMFRNVPHQLI